MCAHVCVHIHTHTYICMHMHACYVYSHTHTRHTHTHTHTHMYMYNKVNTDKLQELRVAAMEHTIALGSHLHKFQNPGWQMPAACADACFSITEKAANMLAAIDKNQMFTPAQLAKQTKRSREKQ